MPNLLKELLSLSRGLGVSTVPVLAQLHLLLHRLLLSGSVALARCLGCLEQKLVDVKLHCQLCGDGALAQKLIVRETWSDLLLVNAHMWSLPSQQDR